jgi:hypothetical protein
VLGNQVPQTTNIAGHLRERTGLQLLEHRLKN